MRWPRDPATALPGLMRAIAVSLLALWPWAAGAQVDYSHLLRIQTSVSFDGERIDFDETIFCGAREKGTLTRRPVTQVLPTRT